MIGNSAKSIANSAIAIDESADSSMDWLRGWDRFWFKPSDPYTLAVMRWCAGIIVLYVHLCYSFDLLSYVGRYAWLDHDGGLKYLRFGMDYYAAPWDWTTPANDKSLFMGNGAYIWSIYFLVHYPAWIYAIHFSILAVMVLFTIGLWTRVTSILSWMGAMCYLLRNPTLLFGMDTMMNLLLIYLMIAPCGAVLSLDSWLRRRRERLAGLPQQPMGSYRTATLATRLLQVNFCMIYFASGTSKLLGSTWWGGTATWGTLANSYFAPMNQWWYLKGLQWLAQHRPVWEISMSAMVVFTLFTELALPFLIWNPRWRWIMICCSIMLHTGIGLFMGLVTFSLCMLTMLLSFVSPEVARIAVGRIAWQVKRGVLQPPHKRISEQAGQLAASR